jgi:hypothetical protein
VSSVERLPHIDEHEVTVAAGPDATWEALLRVAEGSFSSGMSSRAARLLGCADVDVSGPRPLAAGATFPGFHVEAAEQPLELTLAGRHRFSDYALISRLEQLDGGDTRLRAETRAVFPGASGRAYRTIVIGGRIHILAMRRLLSATKRRAERTTA